MNWYKIFYWLTVADNFKNFFVIFTTIFTMISAISTIVYIAISCSDSVDEDDQNMAQKWMWWSYPFCIMFWFLYLFTPSKSDTLLIIAGGSVGNFITSDSASKAIPSDISKFLHMKLQTEILDANEEVKKQLGAQSPKEKLMSKVKDLTKEQLIEYLKNDTTLVR